MGSEYAGLFSNNDKLSKEIINVGQKVEEKLWRMPLHKNYDKLMNSKKCGCPKYKLCWWSWINNSIQFLQNLY